jgi:hypothetical protein
MAHTCSSIFLAMSRPMEVPGCLSEMHNGRSLSVSHTRRMAAQDSQGWLWLLHGIGPITHSGIQGI